MKIKKFNKINLSVLLLMSCSFVSADNPFRPKERVVNNVQNNINQDFETDYYEDPYINQFDFNQNNNQFDFEKEQEQEHILTPEELWEEYKNDLIFIGTLNGERVYRDFDYNYVYKNKMLEIYEKEYKRKLDLLNKNINGEEQ